ncbi:uncharacterized protein LOC62_02G002013 [Vanrija pseudolonga]|uniref:Uncharacterized protein n=1 Tax=Vanrija pseudolonga TaxID=143232 RepID=A0AAF1BI89_9TREE|nr:hypothetical protein LOC62_02G002013 [Vanrija pseudolonga]
MRASIVRLARVPNIHFVGKRHVVPSSAHTPAAHPAAPKDVTNWAAFLKKSHPGGVAAASSSAGGNIPLYPASSKPADFDNFWEAPAYYWQRPELSEREIEAVMSGGATDIRTGA